MGFHGTIITQSMGLLILQFIGNKQMVYSHKKVLKGIYHY